MVFGYLSHSFPHRCFFSICCLCCCCLIDCAVALDCSECMTIPGCLWCFPSFCFDPAAAQRCSNSSFEMVSCPSKFDINPVRYMYIIYRILYIVYMNMHRSHWFSLYLLFYWSYPTLQLYNLFNPITWILEEERCSSKGNFHSPFKLTLFSPLPLTSCSVFSSLLYGYSYDPINRSGFLSSSSSSYEVHYSDQTSSGQVNVQRYSDTNISCTLSPHAVGVVQIEVFYDQEKLAVNTLQVEYHGKWKQ